MKTLYTIYTNFATNFAKRVLTTLIAAVTINIGSIFAVEVTFLPSDFNGKGTITSGSEMSVAKDGVTFHCDKGYGDPDDFRCYKGGTITISSSKKITSISFTCTKADYDGNLDATYSNLNTNSWSETLGEQARITTCVVTYTAEDSGETPGGDNSDDLIGEGGDWVLVTNVSDLKIGDEIIIAAKDYDYALSTEQRNANRGATAVQKSGNTLINPSDDVQILILQAGTESDTWAFYTGEGFLYASSSSANELKTQNPNDGNGSWTISISDEVASIVSSGSTSRDVMQFNAGNTPKIFSCYAKASQAALVIYKHISCSNEVTLSKGQEINATITLINPTELQTCSDVAAERQVTVTATPSEGYELNESSVTYISTSGTSAATFVNKNLNDYIFQFAKDNNGEGTFSVSANPKQYTITFDRQGGENGTDNATVTFDNHDYLPNSVVVPIRFGFNFMGYYTQTAGAGEQIVDAGGQWQSNKTGYIDAEGNWKKADNIVLYAHWQAKTPINYRTLCTYDIVLKNNYVDDDSKDGLATITSTHTAFSTFTIPSAREGYSIEGYYAESECTTKVVNSDKTLIPNVTNYTDADGKWIGGETILYTKWTGRTYTVTLDDNGGSGGSGTITATYGSPMPAITLPTRTGYTFNGYWTGKTTQSTQYYDANGNSLKNWDKAGNMTILYALWTANTNTPYVVKHYKEQLDGTYLAEADDTDNLTGTTASSVTPAVKSYEGFTAPSTQPVTIAADGSTVVTYQYTRNSYNLSWNVNEGDALTGEYTSGNVKYEAAITQPNTPTRIGYTFANWSPEVHATMPADDVTYTAQWQLIQYTITWLCGDDKHATTTVSVETPLSLPEPPANDALGCCADAFIGWSVYAQPTKEQVFNDVANAPVIDGNKTFHAVFATTTLTEGSATATFNEMGYSNAEKVTEIALGDGEGHGDATILFAKEQSASNYPAYYNVSGALHAYAKNTISINSTSATSTITNVQFTFATKEDGSNTISANVGTYADGTWTGSAESVVFTIGGETGHRKITSITVTTQAVEQYTNYVTKCTYGNNPILGTATVTYNSGDGIDVRCEKTSAMNTAATLTFPNAADLTCPITLTASEGFLISTSKSNDAGYQNSLTVSPYKSGSAQAGKLRTIYVRANATGKTQSYSGTITISGGEVTEQTVTVNANVNCQGYTLTLKDHLGNTIGTPTSHYEGDVIETEPTPSSDACTNGYTFDGWSTSEVKYGSVAYSKVTFPYTMPAKDVTLYPVYQCNKTEDYHRVTSDLKDNWAGDYLIAASDQWFADGSTNDLAQIAENNLPTIENNTISAEWGDLYKIAIISVTGGYVLKTKDNTYVFITASGKGTAQNENIATADNHPLTLTYEEPNVKIINQANTKGYSFQYYPSGFCFGFYKSGQPIYLYKKSPLYTTSLICEEVTASDALVTSTAGQTVKVNVIATMDNMTIARQRELTVESDHNDFAATITKTSETTYNVAVSYTPAAEQIIDGKDVANITIKVNNIPVNIFQVTGRHLPQNFVIAAKAGNEWVALTAKVSNGTQVAVPIIVDNKATPTKASVSLNTTQYQLFGLKTNNRYTANGTAVHLYSTQTQKVLNASTATGTKTYLNTDANQTNAETSPNALFYEWKLVSKDLVHYTITNSNQTAGWESNRILGYSAATGMWGMYSKGTNINQDLFLLPVETVLTEIDMEVMEWGENRIALRIPTDAPENIQVTLGENTSEAKALTNLNADGSASDLYKVEGLTLNSNDCEVMMITDADNTTQGTLVRKPIIITGEVESTTYTSDDCPHCDVVVLKDAKLKAGSSHLDFAKIYVYPGGKLVLDGNSLGVKQQVYLRGGYSWLNQETYALPEVYLNGSINFNGSGNIIYDYYIQNYKYYQFALPYTVSLAKVTDEAGVDNFPVWVKHYNGALRAEDAYATSWEWYYGNNFERGEGYIIAAQPRQITGVKDRPLSIIRFPLGNKVFNTTNGLESDLSIITKAHGIGGYDEGTVTANNVGWNFVGNPFLSTWQGDIGHKQLIKHPNDANWDGSYTWADSNVKYITIMSAESGSDYAQYVASETELQPFFPFFMQETAKGGTGSINFAATNRIQKAPAELYADEPREAFVQIEILTDVIEDQTGIFVSDTYSDDIDFDDYEKMFGSSADKSKLWLVHDNKRMAFEAMTETSAAANIALGYRAPKTGSYTFAINEDVSALNEVMGVYLTDHELGVTDYNLLYNTYEFETEAANYNDKRFTIRIVLSDDSNGVVTGVDNIGTMKNGIYKFFYQDKMYIYNNGVIYDGTGKQVTNINK